MANDYFTATATSPQNTMLNKFKLQKILNILNKPLNFSEYLESLESIDLILNLTDDEKKYFLSPEEINIQLPNIFLRNTKLFESEQFLGLNADKYFNKHIYTNSQNILDFLEHVELQEPEFSENKKPPEPDIELLHKLVNKYNI